MLQTTTFFYPHNPLSSFSTTYIKMDLHTHIMLSLGSTCKRKHTAFVFINLPYTMVYSPSL